MQNILINSTSIGPGHPCFIIAEIGVNHNGSVSQAIELIDAAKRAGANAVKFQTFKADRLVSANAPKASYQKATTASEESQLEMLRGLELPDSAYSELIGYCKTRDIVFLSSPFDEACADFLDHQGVIAYKIPSGEITNTPFLEHVARKNKPIILSTGMSNLPEVSDAVKAIVSNSNSNLYLLHCVSAYPAPYSEVNLRAMLTLQETFNLPVGFSDHTIGISIAIAAVAMGACIIEKHFTLDKNLPGPDHQASLTPLEFSAMVCEIRSVESALGSGEKIMTPSESDTAVVARKSIVAATNISAGTIMTEEMITVKRPGTGLSPAIKCRIIGKTSIVDIKTDSLITTEMLV